MVQRIPLTHDLQEPDLGWHSHPSMLANGLRQRNAESIVDEKRADPADQSKNREEVVWGKTPGGNGTLPLRYSIGSSFRPLVFRVPTTHDVITTLLNPNYPKSDFDLLNLALLGLQLALYLLFSRRTAQMFFFLYFAFWRTAYDAGLGWVLTKQSKRKWIVKEVQKRGWLDETCRPIVRDWIRKQLVGKMGNDYSFDVGLNFSFNFLDISPHIRNFPWSIIPGSYSAKLSM